MTMNFEQYAQKGNQLVNHLSDEFIVPRNKAARIFRAVLHALRDRLTLEENFDFLSQLPMVFKAVYIDGWKPQKPINKNRKLSDFLNEVRENDGANEYYDFGSDEDTYSTVQTVFRVLYMHISEGEINDIISTMPKEMKYFIADSKNPINFW